MDFFICLHRMRPERLRPKGESFGPISLGGHLGRGEKEEHEGEEGAERLIPTGSVFGPQKKGRMLDALFPPPLGDSDGGESFTREEVSGRTGGESFGSLLISCPLGIGQGGGAGGGGRPRISHTTRFVVRSP